MRRTPHDFTQAELQARFLYKPETGEVFKRPAHAEQLGNTTVYGKVPRDGCTFNNRAYTYEQLLEAYKHRNKPQTHYETRKRELRGEIFIENIDRLIHKPANSSTLYFAAPQNIRLTQVGSMDMKTGYWSITIDGCTMTMARFIWLYMTGTYPSCHVRFHDGDPCNRRFDNLILDTDLKKWQAIADSAPIHK